MLSAVRYTPIALSGRRERDFSGDVPPIERGSIVEERRTSGANEVERRTENEVPFGIGSRVQIYPVDGKSTVYLPMAPLLPCPNESFKAPRMPMQVSVMR